MQKCFCKELVKSIWDFINTVDIEDIREVIGRQIEYNTAIADEGMRGDYGANIGQVLLKAYGDDVRTRAKARAAAGSDARMNGCELPVIINAGSGNQGMTCSLPVLEYAKELNSGEEKSISGIGSFESCGNSSENRNWKIICILWSSKRRSGSRSRYCLLMRRRI